MSDFNTGLKNYAFAREIDPINQLILLKDKSTIMISQEWALAFDGFNEAVICTKNGYFSEYVILFKADSIEAEKIFRGREYSALDKFYTMPMDSQGFENLCTFDRFPSCTEFTVP